MKSTLIVTMVAATSILLLASGCRPKPSQDLADGDLERDAYQEVPPSPLHDLYLLVDQLLEMGDQDAATRLILEAMDDKQYDKHRAELFTTVVRFLLHTEQLEEAKTRFLNIIRTEPELAMPGFDLIYGYHVNQGDAASTLSWVRELMLQPLTPEMKRPASEWLLIALVEADEPGELLDTLAAVLEEFPQKDSVRIVQRLCSNAQNAKRYELLEEILDVVANSSRKDDLAMTNVVLGVRLNLLAGQARWEEVLDPFADAMALLPDGELHSVFANLIQTARRAGTPERGETLAESLIRSEAARNKERSRNAAAREWVNSAMALENPVDVPRRIGVLIDLKTPPRQVYLSLNRHFYALINDPAILRDLLVQAEVLSPLLEEESTRNALKSLMLDGSFVLEDYDRALLLLEQGIADRDKSWHAMAITKVKAHRALQDQDADEAVRQFRAFMAIVAESEESSPDPVTHVVHTREMILGRNARRIGDLLREAGRQEEASVAYAEARAYYQEALKQAEDPESRLREETLALIRSEMADLPAEDPVTP